MSVLYPYYLYSQQSQAEVPRNDEGDFEETASAAWVLIGECRDEINTKGQTVTQPNGENIQISAIIYAPKDTKILQNGSKVVVSKEKVNISSLSDADFMNNGRSSGQIRLVDSVKGMNLTRLNARIWV